MPLLSLADIDKSIKINQLFYNPLLNGNLLNAQLNLLTAEQLLQSVQPNPKQSSYSRYKTELCRQYSENGQCKYGDKCQFAHGMDELKDVKRHPKYKTDFCKTFHSKGFCPYGPRCHFIHELSESPELISGLSSVTKQKKQDDITSQLANQLLINLKNELDSANSKYDCHDERNLYVQKDRLYESMTNVSLNASPSSTTSSSNSSLNDLFQRQSLLSPKQIADNSPPVRTRSSVSSTSSVFSTTSSSTSLNNPFELYTQQNKLYNKNFIW